STALSRPSRASPMTSASVPPKPARQSRWRASAGPKSSGASGVMMSRDATAVVKASLRSMIDSTAGPAGTLRPVTGFPPGAGVSGRRRGGGPPARGEPEDPRGRHDRQQDQQGAVGLVGGGDEGLERPDRRGGVELIRRGHDRR